MATALEAEVSLEAPDGSPLGRAGDAVDEGGSRAEAGIVVGGQLAAQLTLRSPSEDPLLLELAADRLSGILALAMAQAFRPTPAQVAEARLLEAVIEGGDAESVQRLLAAGRAPGRPRGDCGCVPPAGRDANFPAVERALHVRGVQVKSHLWDGERAVLLALPHQGARAAREVLLRAARESLAGSDTCAAFGPNVADGSRAHDSFVEAREVMKLGHAGSGRCS